ncbi:MAG: glycosyltransferase family 2 protein [Candidatus Binatia bacterium]
MPALSIVMPCFDLGRSARVLEAYDRQTCDDFELIAVDDASRDAGTTVLAGFRPRRYPLRVERLGRNAGPAARNRGLELAQAPLVLFAGDDILPDPGLVAGHLAARTPPRRPTTPWPCSAASPWPADMPCNALMHTVDGAARSSSHAPTSPTARNTTTAFYGERVAEDALPARHRRSPLRHRLPVRGLRGRELAA